jgi:RND family efflux transporter MFP subunit
MKPVWKWVAAGALVLVVGGAVLQSMVARKTPAAAQSATAQAPATTVVELAASDVARAQTRELQQGLPLTGTLKAVNVATLKARVAGELQNLSVREGDAVQAGQVLARIDATEAQARLRQAREQADAAQAQVDIAWRQHDNNQALVAQGFISKTALDTSQANLNAARANHQAAQAAVDVARKTVADTVLTAPISGLVAQRLAQPGERVAVDGRILDIVDLRRMELEATVSASDAAQVRIGQTAQLHLEGSGDAALPPLLARVARINPSTQVGSRSVLVYLSVTPHPALRHGLFAQGLLDTGSLRSLTVPLSAVRTDQPAPYVQVVQQGHVVHQAVSTGARGSVPSPAGNGELMVAITGLAEGAEVIVGSVGTLRPGTAIKLVTPAPGPTYTAPASAQAAASTAAH